MCAHMSFVAAILLVVLVAGGGGGGQLVGLSRGEIESESETIDREEDSQTKSVSQLTTECSTLSSDPV